MKQIFVIVISVFLACMLHAQDVITLKTGEIINAKVSEVGINEIKYYKSENPDGPVYVANKADVAQIGYANGAKDVFKRQLSQPVTQARVYRRRSGGKFNWPYMYPVIVPHIDLGRHGYFGGHHGGYHGGHH